MTPGTRVHHRRSPWMVGTVLRIEADMRFVRWDNEPFKSHSWELPTDLRPTPVQP